jgi:bacterioferritin-associated ferredoxin
VSGKKRVRHAKRTRRGSQTPAPRPGSVTVICRCEEVTEDEIRRTIRQGYTSLEEIKRILRCGMGHCQGRNCLMPIARILNQETGVPVSQMKFPTPRPPLKPLSLGLLGGGSDD